MSNLKKGQAVKARTTRGTEQIPGTVSDITETAKGAWVTVQPNDKEIKPFKTRPALCSPA